MAKHATIRLKGLKVMQPIPAELVPRDLVPPDGPAGNPSIRGCCKTTSFFVN